MPIPNADRARIDLSKLEGYCLSPHHPRGRHKARVFRSALGLELADAAWLREQLLAAAQTADAVEHSRGTWGSLWRFDAAIRRNDRIAVVRSIWLLRPVEEVPLLVSCWVL